ncbi:hypothetical protein Tco_1263113 [Tanacetum coccineum]
MSLHLDHHLQYLLNIHSDDEDGDEIYCGHGYASYDDSDLDDINLSQDDSCMLLLKYNWSASNALKAWFEDKVKSKVVRIFGLTRVLIMVVVILSITCVGEVMLVPLLMKKRTSLPGYGILNLVSFVVFGECRHRYAISSLMDMAYWLSEQ